MAVNVTLRPGRPVDPKWVFEKLLADEIPASFSHNQRDTREQFSTQLTAPQNVRFASVIVNRLWQRYFGKGLVDPVDDWEHATAMHAELLQWLANDFIANGYDLKHTARLLMNSNLYHRAPVDGMQATLSGPMPRRLSAEQLVDSLFVVSSKRLNAGLMAFDIDTVYYTHMTLPTICSV